MTISTFWKVFYAYPLLGGAIASFHIAAANNGFRAIAKKKTDLIEEKQLRICRLISFVSAGILFIVFTPKDRIDNFIEGAVIRGNLLDKIIRVAIWGQAEDVLREQPAMDITIKYVKIIFATFSLIQLGIELWKIRNIHNKIKAMEI